MGRRPRPGRLFWPGRSGRAGDEFEHSAVIGAELRVGDAGRRHGRSAGTRLEHVVVVGDISACLPHLVDLDDVVRRVCLLARSAELGRSIASGLVIDDRLAPPSSRKRVPDTVSSCAPAGGSKRKASASVFMSERDPCADLQLPGWRRSRDQVIVHVCDVGIGRLEVVHVVQRVECFEAQFHIHALGHLDAVEDRSVQVPEARLAARVAAPGCRSRDCLRAGTGSRRRPAQSAIAASRRRRTGYRSYRRASTGRSRRAAAPTGSGWYSPGGS